MLKHISSKDKNYLLIIAIVLSSIAISIRSNNGKVRLILQDYPLAIFLMIVVSSILVVVYFKINNNKIDTLAKLIKEQDLIKDDDFEKLLSELTSRQKEVYDLIIAGRTNKEIMSELFIEKSTLKTHINQIYKKLKIKNRKELKSHFKDL